VQNKAALELNTRRDMTRDDEGEYNNTKGLENA